MAVNLSVPFKELGGDNYADGNLPFDDTRKLDLRSIVKKSTDLPAEMLSADFSHIHDRILDQKIISELTKLPTPETEFGEWNRRCHRRKKALIVDLHRDLSQKGPFLASKTDPSAAP